MGPQARLCIELWAESPAVRSNHGQRPPVVAALFALACRAMRCGSRS